MTKGQNDRRLGMLRNRYIELRGVPPSDATQKFLEADPDFFEHYIGFSGHPWKTGVLPPKVKEFIYIAIDASVTHLYERGIRLHMRRALELGATREELLEVLELVSVLGIHSVLMGVPLLDEECQKRQTNAKRQGNSGRKRSLKATR